MAVIRNLVVKIGADISGLSKGLKNAQTQLNKVSKNLGKIGSTLTRNVTVPLLTMGTLAVKTAASFEQSMANAASVSGATGEELKRMTAIAREMGKTTVFSASEAADAMYYMASAGYKVEQMADAIQPILNLAAATQNDLAETTDVVIATLNQFQLEASSAERVTNVFASAIGNSQATMEKLSASMSYVGPIANSLGWDIEETAAALSVLYNAGYDGSMAGTTLRQALTSLMNPTGSAKKIFDELGISLEQLDPTINSMAEIVDTLSSSGITTAQAMEVFGDRAGPGMMALLAQGSDAISTMETQITDTNSASEMAAKQINTLEGSIKLLKSVMEELAITIGDILLPIIKDFVDKYVTPLINKLANLDDAAKKNILKWAGLAAAIGPAFLMLSKIVKIVSVLVKVLGAVSGTVGIIIVVVAAVALVLVKLFKTNEQFRNKVLKIWDRIKKGIVGAISVIKAWWEENGQAILDSVMRVFETIGTVVLVVIGYIVGAIKTLISSLINLWNTHDSFREGVLSIWNNIKQGIMNIISAIRSWWEENGQAIMEKAVEIFSFIWKVIEQFLGRLMDSFGVFFTYIEPIWNQLKALFMSLWDVLCELWELLKPLFAIMAAEIAILLAISSGVIQGVIQAVGPLIQAILNLCEIVVEIVGVIVSLLRGDMSGAMEHLQNIGTSFKEFFSNLWQAMLNYVSGFADGFVGFFSSMGVDIIGIAENTCGKVGAWFTNMWQSIKDTGNNIRTTVIEMFNYVKDYISDIVNAGFNWGKNLISNFVKGLKSAWNSLKDGIADIGKGIKDFLGFSSPTKKGAGRYADEWMPNMMSMFKEGIINGIPNIQSAVQTVVGTISAVDTITSGVGSGDTTLSGDILNGLFSAMSMGGGNKQSDKQPVELSIDGQVFARLIMPNLVKEFKRNGIVLNGGAV